MKPCKRCDINKELSNYYINKANKDGHFGVCIACKKKETKEKKAWLSLDKEQKALHNKTYRDKHKKEISINQKEYKKKNRAYFNSMNAVRRVKVREEYKELSKEEKERIVLMYKIARYISKTTNTLMHVDHIVPICKGGKHMLSNLQILTAEDNMKKGGRVCQDN